MLDFSKRSAIPVFILLLAAPVAMAGQGSPPTGHAVAGAQAKEGDKAAAPKRGEAKPKSGAVPLSLSVSEEMNGVPKEVSETMIETLQTAFSMIQLFPPKGDNVFKWEGDKKSLEGKQVVIMPTLSTDPLIKTLDGFAGGVPAGTDALTLTVSLDGGESTQIMVLILMDRVFYNEKGKERKDAFARMMALLGHEIYGSVTNSLTKSWKELGARPTEAKRIEDEIVAFSAGVQFLEGILASKEFQVLPQKIQDDMKDRLVDERRGLKSWQDAKEDLKKAKNKE